MSHDNFTWRHIGPREEEIREMLHTIGVSSLDELIDQTIPPAIRMRDKLNMPKGISEVEYMAKIRSIARKNKVFQSYIGQGYYDTFLPSVIKRNILENPSWYTSYTPYQAEISQGRLEALLNFQTMVIELTKMDISNASLLDEATAAAEAMTMLFNSRSRDAVKKNVNVFLVDENIFPQTLAVLQTRAEPLGIKLKIGKFDEFEFTGNEFGVFVQYPAADGSIRDYRQMASEASSKGCQVAVAADIMALVLLLPPGEWGADVVVGSTQRFGIPMGYGGPHAAYFATREKFKRYVPGRIIGVSVDRLGNKALRMALQTREQHIKRERATSNICTAQALLATMAGMYAAYHGPRGLKRIANHIHALAVTLGEKLSDAGFTITSTDYFDTLNIELPKGIEKDDIRLHALERKMNFLYPDDKHILVSFDETKSLEDVNRIAEVFSIAARSRFRMSEELSSNMKISNKYFRADDFLKEDIFNIYHSETEMMRYIKKLERRDYSLTHSMIPLGSCTMKLNAAMEMFALGWEEFGRIHPFVPIEQTEGYQQLFHELGRDLCKITGFNAISFQPNSGAAGEYTGLMVIREYHKSRGEEDRNVVLIPSSAHGTNPASAVMAGMEVVIVNCDEGGNIDLQDLTAKAEKYKDTLCAFMITYPSTHGVFEPGVKEMTRVIHENGGQVYMDGANMNAQVGLTNPAIIGADVCHLNLHKTFAIPHGGGGPGVGPIAVADHLIEFLPTHPLVATGGKNGIPAIAAAPMGSASILTISHAYCKMLGEEGLTLVTKIAILNANYIASSLKDKIEVLYKGKNGRVAHEMILDCRPIKNRTGITETDIAKRLIDYGFHAPTLSFPVHGTLMVEPTESESLYELNRFIEATRSILREIQELEEDLVNKEDNLLKNAPHTAGEIAGDEWDHPYSRQKAAFPLKWIEENKFWPFVARIDDAYGDRNLICSCKPLEEYRQEIYPDPVGL